MDARLAKGESAQREGRMFLSLTIILVMMLTLAAYFVRICRKSASRDDTVSHEP